MAKLSDAQINGLKFYALGEGDAPQKRTRDSLVKNGFLRDDNTVTDDGFTAAGIERATVDEITELLDAPHGTLLCDQAEAYGVAGEDKPIPAQWVSGKFAQNNLSVWQGLSNADIHADIATAVPIGRAAQRYARKHAAHSH